MGLREFPLDKALQAKVPGPHISAMRLMKRLVQGVERQNLSSFGSRRDQKDYRALNSLHIGVYLQYKVSNAPLEVVKLSTLVEAHLPGAIP